MSGGSWQYFYQQLAEVAERLQTDHKLNPRRVALGVMLEKAAAALRSIEWNDSGDGDGNEEAHIEAALGENAQQMILAEQVKLAKEIRDELSVLIDKVEPKKRKKPSHG